MEYFLENIAGALYSEFGNNLNRHCLVFPNRRAGLFFMKYLSRRIGGPVWTPAVYTINELFRRFSGLQTAPNEILLFELYKVYRKVKKSAESFDDFYFWGDMLLNDFDDVDKYLVNARSLFSNVMDIKNIDRQFGSLSDEQVEIIRKFWINFNPDLPSKQKEGFLDIWSVLFDLYDQFRKSLYEGNLAYEGMIFRETAEMREDDFGGAIRWDLVHFIGFNALNECEKIVMTRLKKGGRARFYWDYDESYLDGGNQNSAGYFMRGNLKAFGNDLSPERGFRTLLSAGPPDVKRRIIETSSDIAQVKLIPGLLRQIPGITEENAHQTAVVLADENLLIPVLTSMPEGDINITMGFPLRHTPVYTFVRHLMDLQRNAVGSGGDTRFGYRDVLGILKHPFAELIMGERETGLIKELTNANLVWIPSGYFKNAGHLSRIFVRPSNVRDLTTYFKDLLILAGSFDQGKNEDDNVQGDIRNEFLYRAVLAVNRLEAMTGSGDIPVSADICMRILDRMLRLQSVPFTGEPLSGIQIMGILETRALDFRNLIILSVNEGVLPSVSSGSSFIPYSLREAFGLPSINHQESVYAYHFYRLLQRAENVTLLYNSNSDGLRTGEMSRFLVQMKYDTILKPEILNLSFEIRPHGSVPEVLERSVEHTELIRNRYPGKDGSRILSPSAINTWLSCRMKFFYRYVCGLREPDVITGDIDPAALGNILHDVMRDVYSGFTGAVITPPGIEKLRHDRKLLMDKIVHAIDAQFNGGSGRKVEGTEFIVRDVLLTYVDRILSADLAITPFRVLHLEESFRFPVTVSVGAWEQKLSAGGIIDRVDLVGDTVRIIDYKTGAVAEKIGSIADLFREDRAKELDGWLQILLYCEAYIAGSPGSGVQPSIYRIRKMSVPGDGDLLKIRTESGKNAVITDYLEVRDEFMANLTGTIENIFSDDQPFVMTKDIRGKCAWCEYRGLCSRD